MWKESIMSMSGYWGRASLRAQIAVLMSVTMLVTLIITIAVISRQEYVGFEAQVAERLETEAHIVATGSEATLVFDEAEGAQETLDALKAAPHVIRAKLLRPDGTVLAAYERARPDSAELELLTHTYPIKSGEDVVGSLEISASREDLYAALYARAATTLVAVGLALVITIFLATRVGLLVADPIATLSTTARKIADGRDYSVRADVAGTGEVREFARVFNDMLAQIQERDEALMKANEEIARASQALADASRQAGMAEMAVGVLHNVGNAVTSVVVSGTLAQETIRRFEFDRVDKALALLDDPGKRGQARQYLEKVNAKHTRLLETISAETDTLLGRLEHIQAIISHQQDTAKRGSNVIQQVELPVLVGKALELVTDTLQRHGIELDKEYADLGEYPVDRHKALQILVNLFTNAKDSIVENGGDRKISVRILKVDEDHAEIRVKDSGTGISAENLARVFELGFTTKKDGHGFGLHSSANAAREMGANLDVDSEGEGKGATFSLQFSR